MTSWDENIVLVISMILPEGLRSKTFDLMKVLLREKHFTFKDKYTITHLKNRYAHSHAGIFTSKIKKRKSKVKVYEIFLKMIMNHIPGTLT